MDANTFHPLLHDRGRGPELVGTRITVYNVWDELFNPDVTEADLCRRYEITPEEVAALRAFAFRHYAEVSEGIRKMDERTAHGMAEQATPEFLARFWWNADRLAQFKRYLAVVLPDLTQPADRPRDYFRHRREFRAMVEASEAGHATANGTHG